VEIAAGKPGETCVRLRAADAPPAAAALVERCTFGVVFPASVRVAPGGRAVALAVAPLPAWSELWLLRADAAGAPWRIDVLPPAVGEPGDDIGYAELAGFSPDGRRALVARDFRVGGKLGRRFEVLVVDTTVVERWATTPDRLVAFQRWASPLWRKTTLAAR
jgi:hypothetical protein